LFNEEKIVKNLAFLKIISVVLKLPWYSMSLIARSLYFHNIGLGYFEMKWKKQTSLFSPTFYHGCIFQPKKHRIKVQGIGTKYVQIVMGSQNEIFHGSSILDV
jgi:hypothetical protein